MQRQWGRSIFFVIIMLGPAFYFGVIGKPTEMGLAIVAGALTATFLNLDKFQKFKGAGFEAEMKEVKKAVEEAYATMQNLKDVTTPMIMSLLDNMTFAGRWGGMDIRQKHILKSELDKISTSLQLKNDKLDQARERFIQFHTWDFYESFTSSVVPLSDKEILDQFKQLRKRETTDYPSRDQIVKIIDPIKANLSQESWEKLEDYNFYKDNQKLRRNATLD